MRSVVRIVTIGQLKEALAEFSDDTPVYFMYPSDDSPTGTFIAGTLDAYTEYTVEEEDSNNVLWDYYKEEKIQEQENLSDVEEFVAELKEKIQPALGLILSVE